MKIRLLGSSVGVPDGRQNLTSFLINDRVAIDAGALGCLSPLALQKQIEHVFLSHSHIDHIATLPLFLDNVYVPGPSCPTVYGSAIVLESLQRDIFNERVWPDLTRLSAEESMFLRSVTLRDEHPVSAGNLRITPVPVDHVVPTHGFLIEDDCSAILVVSDSGPTERIWEVANACPNLRAVFMECSFPNALEWLALKTKHLSPNLFQQELLKLKRPARVIAVHIKTGHHAAVTAELQQIKFPNFEIGGGDCQWEF